MLLATLPSFAHIWPFPTTIGHRFTFFFFEVQNNKKWPKVGKNGLEVAKNGRKRQKWPNAVDGSEILRPSPLHPMRTVSWSRRTLWAVGGQAKSIVGDQKAPEGSVGLGDREVAGDAERRQKGMRKGTPPHVGPPGQRTGQDFEQFLLFKSGIHNASLLL